MKLRFEPDIDFQRQAIDAVCDLFRRQEIYRTKFTVAPTAHASLALPDSGDGRYCSCSTISYTSTMWPVGARSRMVMARPVRDGP